MMNRSDFPIILVGMYDYVEGATRLQKYAFLSAMRIPELKKINFYGDWEGSDYGPFSKQLAVDVEIGVKQNRIGRFKIKNTYNFDVERFSVTDGKEILEKFKNEYPSEYKKIYQITLPYQSKTLSQLLQDVYYQYPEFTKASKIKAEVGRQIYESDSYLSTKYDEPDI